MDDYIHVFEFQFNVKPVGINIFLKTWSGEVDRCYYKFNDQMFKKLLVVWDKKLLKRFYIMYE